MNSKAMSFIIGLILVACALLVGVRSASADEVGVERPLTSTSINESQFVQAGERVTVNFNAEGTADYKVTLEFSCTEDQAITFFVEAYHQNVFITDCHDSISFIVGAGQWYDDMITGFSTADHGYFVTAKITALAYDNNGRFVASYYNDSVQFSDNTNGGAAIIELDDLQVGMWYKLDVMLDCNTSEYDQLFASGQTVECGSGFTIYNSANDQGFLEIIFNRWGTLQTMGVDIQVYEL